MADSTRQPMTDAVEILRRRYVAGNPGAESLLDEARAEAELARTIHRLRTEAKLTQQDLARRIGTTASVISRLEDADYTGHSLAMLRRIAVALGRRVEIRFPTVKGQSTAERHKASPGSEPEVAVSSPTEKGKKSGKSVGTAKVKTSKAESRSSSKVDTHSK